jgi:hypothetical protein
MAELARHRPATGHGAPRQSQALQEALAPLLLRVGGEVVHDHPEPGDVPVEWHGEVLFHVRLSAPAPGAAPSAPGAPPSAPTVPGVPDLTDGLARLIADVEGELGGRLSELPRAEKQHAVRLLEERGAFEMRRSAETVAEALGVTRFTVYNYLNRVRDKT